ncbi:ABC transporter substrate-binding protein [Flindersiella endophytica]
MADRLRLAYREFSGFQTTFGLQVSAFREQRPDAEIELVPYEVHELYDAMAGGGCRSGDFDLFLCNTDWLPELIRDGSLLPLDELMRRAPLPGWPDAWSPSLRGLQTAADGSTYGLPYHDGPQMFMYRGDLFDEHGIAPPETWQDFLEVAKYFDRPNEDLYGCVLAALPDGHNNVYDFLIQLWSRGGTFLDGRRAAFDGPEGQAALTFLHDLIRVHQVTQPDPRAYDSVGSGDFYAGGRAAMMWNWCGFAAVADLPGSAIHGRNRLGPLPRGDGPDGRHTSLSVYWVLAIPAGSRQPELAWEFLRHVASPEMDVITATQGGIGCRLSTWRSPAVQREFACYRLIEQVHADVETVPGIPEYPAIADVLNAEIDAVYTGAKPVAAALAAAAGQTNRLLGKGGVGR